jgi:hypothetical protein
VDSIVQLIQTLSTEEQQLLIQRLNTLLAATDEPVAADPATETPDAWDVFLSIGSEAQPGHLQDAALKHDHYLYHQPS